MKASVFNTCIPTSDPESWIVYNTLHRTVAVLPSTSMTGAIPKSNENGSRIYRSLQGQGPGATSNAPRLDLIALSPSTKDQLKSLRFIVDDDHDEFGELDNFLQVGYKPDTFCPVVAVTAACNLDCVYCFEEGSVDRRERMSATNSGKAILWMEKYISENPELKRLSLGLFGGEPLLYIPACEFFIKEAAEVARTSGLTFDFGITTNGTRLTRELVDDWTKKGLSFIRVTLDGPKHVHDERRPFRSKRRDGSFELILSNLVSIADIDGFELEIEINIDRNNYKYVPELLDILEARGLKNRISVVPEQTFESLASAGKSTGCGSGGCGTCASKELHAGAKIDAAKNWFEDNLLSELTLSDAFIAAVTAIGEKGFRMPEMVGVYYPCIFVQRHHVVIDWSGDIYKCSFTIGNHEMRAGDISVGFNDNNKKMLESVKTVEWCKERKCAYIPLCGGGCRYEAFNMTGSYNVPNCKAELIDAVLPRTVPYFFGAKPRA